MPAMENDPAREWQRMQEVYARMSEDELEKVAGEAYGLTDIAKQALEAEIRTRRLDISLPQSPQEPVEEEPIGEAEFDPANFELAEVRTAWDAADARMAKGILDAAGIRSYFGPDNLESIDEYKGSYARGVKLRVLSEHQQLAYRTFAQRWPEDPNREPEPEPP